MGRSERITAQEFMEWSDWGSEPDAASVGWQEMASIRKPEFFHFNASQGGQGWVGAMAFDRQRGVLYLAAQVL